MSEPAKKPAPFFLRDVEPSDLEPLWRLDQVCFTRGIAYSKAELTHFIKQAKSFTIVAESEREIRGFIVVERDAKNSGRIITIDVHPDSRRAGLGSLLMRVAEERLLQSKSSRVVLEVAVDNTPAITFYKRHGYSVFGTIPRYYLGSLDALRMEKMLSG